MPSLIGTAHKFGSALQRLHAALVIMLSSCKLATWNSYWKIVLAFLMTCVLTTSHQDHTHQQLWTVFFCSLQSHTACKIHLRHESQRNVWAIITLHICGSFFQSSWEFQQSWAISKKTGFSPQMTSWSCHKVARSGLSSQLSYLTDQNSTKTYHALRKKTQKTKEGKKKKKRAL